MRFSERVKIKSVKTVIQVNGIDSDLRNGLINVFYFIFREGFNSTFGESFQRAKKLIDKIQVDFKKKLLLEAPLKDGTRFLISYLTTVKWH